MELFENEKIEDLQINGFNIIQNKKMFQFGIDAVLLSDYAKGIRNNSTIVDLGTGTGIIGILLCAKANPSKIIGIEIQKDVAEMARRSVLLNNLEDKFQIINDDLNNVNKYIKKNSIDSIVVNPPYKKVNSGIKNQDLSKQISRHEVKCTLEDIANVSSNILKSGGSIYMVHRPERLVDILSTFRSYSLEPKKLRMVYSRYNQIPKLILIKAVKNAKPELKIDKPLYIYTEDGSYSEEIKRIYGGDEDV